MSDPRPNLGRDVALTESEQQILDFEGQWWRHQGSKDDAVRTAFGVSRARHEQRVLALIDREEALAYAPSTVKRLQRLRDKNRRTVTRRVR